MTETEDYWECDYCKKEFHGEYTAEDHEQCCEKNPDRLLNTVILHTKMTREYAGWILFILILSIICSVIGIIL